MPAPSIPESTLVPRSSGQADQMKRFGTAQLLKKVNDMTSIAEVVLVLSLFLQPGLARQG